MTEKQQAALRAKAEKQAQKQAREDAREQALREKAATKSGRAQRRLLHRAERHQVRANAAKVRGKQFTERADGKINDAEWKRIQRSRRNHRLYDAVSAVTRPFLPKNPLREDGMEFWGPDMSEATGPNKLSPQAKYTNKGRVFLGGTKAMNLFENAAGKQFLCKEAVTCVGTYKPMGALVTEAASRLQDRISPDTAVRAFTYKKDGRVLGSLQERLDVKPDGFDLFKWQADPSQPIPAHLADQILREHVTDWLLCNFDTKGENFLEDTQGRLRGIDKEQALSFLGHKDAQHMSYTFSPNPNDTLYNSVFRQYAQGKMDLNLMQVAQHIRAVEAIPDEQYLDMFYEVVHAKCHGDVDKMIKMNGQLLDRKHGLRDEYQRFFGELNRERGDTELLDENGRFSFLKAAEKLAERTRPTHDPELVRKAAEASARVRETDAQAREAEARARQAEAISREAAAKAHESAAAERRAAEAAAIARQAAAAAAQARQTVAAAVQDRTAAAAAAYASAHGNAAAKAREAAAPEKATGAGPAAQEAAAPQKAPEPTAKAPEAAAKTAAPLDRSQFEKPLTMEESLQAQRLHTQLARAVRSVSRQMAQPELPPEQRDALGAVKTAAETIKDYNAKRLAGRITPDESAAFHRLLDPAHAKESGARPEVVKFTQELRQVMAPEKDAPVRDAPKPPVKEAPKLSKRPARPSRGPR